MKFRFELIPLIVNLSGFLFYAIKHNEPGKILYWLGAVLLTAGLLLTKG